jgi:hypothetical protein
MKPMIQRRYFAVQLDPSFSDVLILDLRCVSKQLDAEIRCHSSDFSAVIPASLETTLINTTIVAIEIAVALRKLTCSDYKHKYPANQSPCIAIQVQQLNTELRARPQGLLQVHRQEKNCEVNTDRPQFSAEK